MSCNYLLCKCEIPEKGVWSFCSKCGLPFAEDPLEFPTGVCCDNPTMRKDKANYVSINCGQCSLSVFTYYRGFDYYVRKKATHSRTRWFRNMVIDYVKDYDDRELLTNDFQRLARVYEKYNLLNGRNISVYGYYIIKLAEHRGIPLISTSRTVKTKRACKEFDKRYETACKILGY